MQPENKYRWGPTLEIHQISGWCLRSLEFSTVPTELTVLCKRCHAKKHPHRIADLVTAGGEIVLPFEVTGNLSLHEKLLLKRRFCLAINFFIDALFNEAWKRREFSLRADQVEACHELIPFALKWKAAERAVSSITTWSGLSHRKRKEYLRLSEHEQKSYMRSRQLQHLERTKQLNLSRPIEIKMGKSNHSCPRP
jgi:hypothetical protein